MDARHMLSGGEIVPISSKNTPKYSLRGCDISDFL
jgi:hypothetical protein